MPITGTELSTISTDVSAGSGDHGKIVLLNSSGLVDDSMLPDFGAGTITTVAAGSGISVSGGTGPTATVSASYGTSSSTVCVGNDSRLSDARTPTGSAGGDLAGTYPNPTVAKIHETGGPTALTIGAIADGKFLVRSGSTVVGADGGADGTTWYWYATSEVMVDSDGVDGDYAIIVDGPEGNGNIYQKLTGHWTAIGNIRGGDGIAGTQIRSGTTAPDDSIGVNGDFYLRSDTGQFYKRIGGTYTLILTMALSISYGTGLNLSGGTLTVSFGSSSATACIGNDSRLSDDRTASGLRSASTVVTVSAATAPTSGQVLTATSGTVAAWSTPSTTATALASASTTVNVSAATAPSTGQVLTATDSTHATWQSATGGAASDLATTGASVNVSSASPPSTGKVLTATDATHATWQTPSGGGGGTSNPFIDAPASPHADNDEFTGWSGWTVYDITGAATMTDDGDGTIDPWTFPSSGHYRRKTVGTYILLQFPKTSNTMMVYKAITPASNMLVWSRWASGANFQAATNSTWIVEFGLFQNSSGRPQNSGFTVVGSANSTGRKMTSYQNGVSQNDAVTYGQGVSVPDIVGIFEKTTSSRSVFLVDSRTGDHQIDDVSPRTSTSTTAYVGWRVIPTGSSQTGGACPILCIDYFRRLDSSTAWIV